MNPGIYKKRITQVKKLLSKTEDGAALILSSAPYRTRSGDTHYPYMQDKNLFYLCGSEEPGLVLLITTRDKKPHIFTRRLDKMRLLWEGPRYELELAVKNSGAELIQTDNIQREVSRKLRGINTLYYQNDHASLSFTIARPLLELPSHDRRGLPSNFKSADSLMARLRLYKDAQEIKLIEKAIEITFNSWCLTLPLVMAGTPECLLAATIDYGFRTQNSDYAFSSIVAAGKNASILHYHKLRSKLKTNDLLLFDIGASYQGYAADISRTVPVSKEFSEKQLKLYNIVLRAQKAAIKKIKPGALIKDAYDAAASVILKGLIEAKVLRGRFKKLKEDGAYKQFFPHGIGHSLGLDVHDIGEHRGNNRAKFEKDMVFTVEPGIYLPKNVSGYPACGIRIEDNVLVTQGGCRLLSGFIPKEPEDIEELMRSF